MRQLILVVQQVVFVMPPLQANAAQFASLALRLRAVPFIHYVAAFSGMAVVAQAARRLQ